MWKLGGNSCMSVLKNPLIGNFSMIPNEILCAKQLSFGSRVLYCYLLSKPNDWKIWNYDIMNQLGINNKNTIAKYFRELIDNGWIDRKRAMKDNKLSGGYDYEIINIALQNLTQE